MENLGIIIQARTGSTRLPFKMTLPFFNDRGILELLLSRLKKQGWLIRPLSLRRKMFVMT